MPTFDDEIPARILPRGIKKSKFVQQVKKMPIVQDAAIRKRFTDESQGVNLIAILNDLWAGEMPTNEQICDALKEARSIQGPKDMSDDCRKLLLDAQALLDVMQKV